MSSDSTQTLDQNDPLLHRPHADEEVQYGNNVELMLDPAGGPATVIRSKPAQLNWESLSTAAKNMFADLAGDQNSNRYQVLVESCLINWADKMSSSNPNKLPDGNPTYLQDDVIPVIKAYVNRVPRPGISGSPIPPAISMAELEALDFLHFHQALPYQQRDYSDIFGRMPDGFIWHPVQTLVGTRGLDHRTLFEFRAYKHFWAIHKDNKSIREISTKDDPTWEVNILRPGTDIDFPGVIPGGFHNLSIPPNTHQLRKELSDVNKERKKDGKPIWSPIMYVRFADDNARILLEHHNDPDVFDVEGIPRMREIGRVSYREYTGTEDFLESFTQVTRATVTRLPTIKETRGEEKQNPSSDTTTTDTGRTLTTEEFDLAADLVAKFMGGADIPIDAASAATVTATNALKKLNQRIKLADYECCAHAVAAATTGDKTVHQNPALKAELDAIEAKIKQLMIEKENPRQLAPMSQLPGNGYSCDATAPGKSSSSSSGTVVGAVMLSKDKSTSKCTRKGAATSGMKASILDIPVKTDFRLIPETPGTFFATHMTRPILVAALLGEDPGDIPTTGPGAKSWGTLKEETRCHPIALESEIMDQSAKEHIKNLAVVSLQQTVYYYLVTADRMERKKVAMGSPDATCFTKVTEILERGQRLVIEYLNIPGAIKSEHYIRAAGAPRIYDRSMKSDKKAIPQGLSSVNIMLNNEEQAVYWKLMEDTKPLWQHPPQCGCWGWKR
ncbi:hypothetical protein TWF696_004306 [Orbilia brochopaga]|uniref:Uncharacterized protein n=1 Tax=Orbilia brochopaga TaxID=3140254 RepID=A0AAV9V5Z6_9PEZI